MAASRPGYGRTNQPSALPGLCRGAPERGQ